MAHRRAGRESAMTDRPPGWYPAMSNARREFLGDVATVALILAVCVLDYGVIRPRKAERACTRTGRAARGHHTHRCR